MPSAPAHAIGTDFTYQGPRLNNAGSPITGTVDLQFSLWDAAVSGGTQQGLQPITRIERFGDQRACPRRTLTLAASVLNTGANRWIQVAVRNPAGVGVYTTLTPRQPLTPTPYAPSTPPTRPAAARGRRLAAGSPIQTRPDFVGINRSNIIGSEWFGVYAPGGAGGYGGMYISSNSATGQRFLRLLHARRIPDLDVA